MNKTKKRAEKTLAPRFDEISMMQLKYLLRIFRPDKLKITKIKDPDYTLQALIEGKIEGLSNISDLINHYFEEYPKLRDAAIPDLERYLKPEYQEKAAKKEMMGASDFLKTVPDQEKYCTITWNDFRKTRQSRFNEYSLSKSLNVFIPSTLRIFPLLYLRHYTEPFVLKMIQDDCNDMVDFLKNVKILNPIVLIILFSRIDEILFRFFYYIGYQRMKYETKKLHLERTSKSTEAKRKKRDIHKYQVGQEFIYIVNKIGDRNLSKGLSENWTAKEIKERIGKGDDGKYKIGLTHIKALLKEEFIAGKITPPWIK